MDTGPERAETVGLRRTCTRPRSLFTLPRWGHARRENRRRQERAVRAGRPEAIAAPAGLAEGHTGEAAIAEGALDEAPGAPRPRGKFAPQDARERRELLAVERDKPRAGVERRKLPLDRLRPRLLPREFSEQRLRRLPVLDRVEQVPNGRRDRGALALQSLAPLGSLGAASLRTLDRPGHEGGERPLVEGLAQRREDGGVEPVLANHDGVRTDGGAALLVIGAAVDRDATALAGRPVGARHGGERAAAHRTLGEAAQEGRGAEVAARRPAPAETVPRQARVRRRRPHPAPLHGLPERFGNDPEGRRLAL